MSLYPITKKLNPKNQFLKVIITKLQNQLENTISVLFHLAYRVNRCELLKNNRVRQVEWNGWSTFYMFLYVVDGGSHK